MAESYHSAQIVKTSTGKQYHVGAGPGDVARRILLVGDPARAEKVATRFDRVQVERRNREYVTITGDYQGEPLTVTATGIGCDNTEIAFVELSQCVDDPTFIRVGSCGALDPSISLGDLVISSGAVKLESTSGYFVPEGYPSVAHWEVVAALVEATADLEGRRAHVGITATASGFYGAQGRQVPGFPPRDPELPGRLATMGVKNMEMEASLLFTLGSLRGLRTGAVCAVYASRTADTFVDTDLKDRAEAACIDAGLRAFSVLSAMDRARQAAGASRWRPGLGLAP
ncbi:MAG: nucleoside phosphorylase [Planctomycetes bacterium]|nr:nucleoside phosphorylase [Planctomycetota bacterium]